MRPALFAVPLPESLDRERQDRFLAVLPPERRERLARLLRPEKAHASLLGEILVRRVLGGELGIPWEAVRIAAGPHGKPALADRSGPHFNVSHSGVWVVAAFANRPVGVDVERIRPVAAGVAASVLALEERRMLFAGAAGAGARLGPGAGTGMGTGAGLLDNAASRAFIEHWTLKESYVKMTGTGFAVPPERLAVRRVGARVLAEPPGLEGDAFCRRYDLDPAYALSLCSLDPRLPERVEVLEPDAVFDPG